MAISRSLNNNAIICGQGTSRYLSYIYVFCRYFRPGSDPLELDEKFWELRDSVVQCELLILRQLNFHVSFEHPHKVMQITENVTLYFFYHDLDSEFLQTILRSLFIIALS